MDLFALVTLNILVMVLFLGSESVIEPNIKLLKQTVLDHDIARTWSPIVDLHVLAIS